MAFEVRKLNPTFGVEVLGIDLTKEITADILDEVKSLWAEHQLLLFRGQPLEEKDAVAFSGLLGELEIHVRREYLSPENPEILYVSNMKVDGKAIGILSDTEVGWHYDQIYLPRPALGSLLYAVTLPTNGGQTSFADMSAAYESLSDDIKATLKGRKAIQSYEAFNNQYSVPTDSDQKKRTPDIKQPVIRTHPISGRKALYICPGMTTQIVGLPKDESRDLLDYLFDWSVKTEFVYTHNWVHDDAVLWDNAATMHRREPFDGKEERLMKRTTILPPADLAVPV